MSKIRFFLCIALLAMAHFQAAGQGEVIRQSIERKFDAYKEKIPGERVMILSDKDVYTPGEQVWFSGFTYDYLSTDLVSLSREMKIDLVDSKYVLVTGSIFNIDKGVVNGYIKLPLGLKEGIYFLQGVTDLSGDGSYYYRKILVKDKAIPPYMIEASFVDKVLKPGDEAQLTLKFLDFYSEPKKNVSYLVEFFDGDTKAYGADGKTKKDGVAMINFKIPEKLKSGIITYRVIAEVKKQHVSHSGVIPVASDKTYIDFYPVNGHMVNGKTTKVYFYTYGATGQPVSIEADLFDSENVIQSLSTGDNGIGTFNFVPELGNNYYLKVKSPTLLSQKYDLPEIHPKGLTLSILEKTSSLIKYRLSSGYTDPRLVYLVAHSNGKIKWFSEHEVMDEMDVDIDISEWQPGVVQVALINAAERIEGEHVFYIEEKGDDFEFSVSAESPSQRSKVSIATKFQGDGHLVITSVNDPWLAQRLNNHNANILALPYDFLEEPITISGLFSEQANEGANREDLLHFYTPRIFSWSSILDTKGDYEQEWIDDIVLQNKERYDKIIAFSSEIREEGKIIQHNLSGSDYFYASNPNYIYELYKEKVERVPSYKKMLETGTPVLEVLKVIKPYNLQGSNIVFMGSANSINFQGGALIAIDGVNRGTDASVLTSISPYDVESISASTDPNDIQRYTGLNSVGIVEIELKKGNENFTPNDEESPADEQFNSPDYEQDKMASVSDERSTLLWSCQPVKSDGPISTVYFNSDLISNVQGRLVFFPASGIPKTKVFNYQIK